MSKEESLIEYPCEFPIKAFGKSQAEFPQAVTEIMLRHDSGFKADSITTKSSKTAKYTSLTCTIHATSREQLDAIYQELSDHPMVVMTL